ncbi:MAG: hypothetical protein JWO58_142 [Chitinophagaceae bacterium]|nr:hypothetical protein [Chitinophagaceae bacterium]
MKKTITSFALLGAILSTANAQIATTVSMGTSYANNVWYNMEDGETGTSQSASNWDIALAATISPSSGSLASSVIFNPKAGTLFVAPAATPTDDFTALDTTGLSASWTKLYNSDQAWLTGAFNQPAGAFPDYGWGAYDAVNHTGIVANRIFVIRYGSTPATYTYKKLYITLSFASNGVYTVTYDKLDNSDPHTATVGITSYSTKNYVYYSLSNNNIVDREPASSAWDILFTQYVTTSELYQGASNQLVGGVLLNKGVTAAQANDVSGRTTYNDYSSQTFSSNINTIGWDWKFLNGSFQWEVVNDTVYFIKRANGDIWKLYFTSFGGSSNGNFNFTKEKLSTTTGLFNNASTPASLALYPNPTSIGYATVIYDFNGNSNTMLEVQDLTGNELYKENISSTTGLNIHSFSTATLQPGIYVVSVHTDGAVLQQKLVVR